MVRIDATRVRGLWASLGKQTGIYVLASLVTAALPFMLLPILTRELGPADYGRAAMFSVLVTTTSQLVGVGSYGALGVRKFELDPRSFSAYIRACLIILLRASAALALLTVVLQVPLSLATGLPLTWLLVALLAATAQGILQMAFAVWVAESRATTYGAVQILQMGANLCLSILLVVLLSLGWEGRALGITLAVCGGAAAALVLVGRAHDLGRHHKVPAHRRDALRFGLPLVPHALGGLLMVVTDRFIVSSLLGAGAVGVYMVAVQIGLAMTLFTEAFNRAYAPWLMRRLAQSESRDDLALVRTTWAYVGILLVAALVLGALGAPVVRLLAGDEFSTAGDLVRYIALGCAFTGCYYMVTNYIFFAGATKALAVITLGLGLVNVPVTWGLVTLLGISGAAISYALVQLVAFLLTWRLAHKIHPMPWFTLRRGSADPGSRF